MNDHKQDRGRRRFLQVADVPNQELDERVATLWRAARLGPTVERLRRHVLQAGDVSIEPGQFRALDTIAAHGPCPIREIALVMDIEPSSATRAVARLEESGYVVKERAKHDHREVHVRLTSAGVNHHEIFVDRAFEVYEDIFVGFTNSEKLQLADYLERLLKATDAALADRKPARSHEPSETFEGSDR